MMLIAPNSLVRQKEWAQGEEAEEAAGRRKARPTGTPTPGADDPIGPLVELGQGCRMRRIEENMDGGVGFQSTGGAERARDQSYPLTIGMEGGAER